MFVRARAAKDEVGMAVDQAGRDPSFLEIDARLGGAGILARADIADLVAGDADRRILDGALGRAAGHGGNIAVF